MSSEMFYDFKTRWLKSVPHSLSPSLFPSLFIPMLSCWPPTWPDRSSCIPFFSSDHWRSFLFPLPTSLSLPLSFRVPTGAKTFFLRKNNEAPLSFSFPFGLWAFWAAHRSCCFCQFVFTYSSLSLSLFHFDRVMPPPGFALRLWCPYLARDRFNYTYLLRKL